MNSRFFLLLLPLLLLSTESYAAWDYVGYANGKIMADVFDGIKSIVTANSQYKTLIVIVTVSCFIWVMFKSVMDGKYVDIILYFLLIWVGQYLLFVKTIDIVVTDQFDGGAVYNVTDVPFIIGLPVVAVNSIGNEFTILYETNFTAMSADLRVSSGNAPGSMARMLRDMGQVSIGDPTLRTNTTNYFHDCVLPMIYDGTTTKSKILKAESVLEEIKSTHLARYTSVLTEAGNETITSCNAAWLAMQTTITAVQAGASSGWMQYISPSSSIGNDSLKSAFAGSISSSTLLDAAIEQGTGTGTASGTYLANMLLSGGIDDGVAAAAAAAGSNEVLTALNLEQARKSQQTSWVTGGELFQDMAGYFYSGMNLLIVALTPLLMVALFIPKAGTKVLGMYFKVLVWLALWWPGLAVVNYMSASMLESQIAAAQGGCFGCARGSVQDALMNSAFASKASAAAGFLATIVPMLMWGIVSGSAQALVGALQQASGRQQANAAAQNIASGSYQGDNVSYNNTSSNHSSDGYGSGNNSSSSYGSGGNAGGGYGQNAGYAGFSAATGATALDHKAMSSNQGFASSGQSRVVSDTQSQVTESTQLQKTSGSVQQAGFSTASSNSMNSQSSEAGQSAVSNSARQASVMSADSGQGSGVESGLLAQTGAQNSTGNNAMLENKSSFVDSVADDTRSYVQAEASSGIRNQALDVLAKQNPGMGTNELTQLKKDMVDGTVEAPTMRLVDGQTDENGYKINGAFDSKNNEILIDRELYKNAQAGDEAAQAKLLGVMMEEQAHSVASEMEQRLGIKDFKFDEGGMVAKEMLQQYASNDEDTWFSMNIGGKTSAFTTSASAINNEIYSQFTDSRLQNDYQVGGREFSSVNTAGTAVDIEKDDTLSEIVREELGSSASHEQMNARMQEYVTVNDLSDADSIYEDTSLEVPRAIAPVSNVRLPEQRDLNPISIIAEELPKWASEVVDGLGSEIKSGYLNAKENVDELLAPISASDMRTQNNGESPEKRDLNPVSIIAEELPKWAGEVADGVGRDVEGAIDGIVDWVKSESILPTLNGKAELKIGRKGVDVEVTANAAFNDKAVDKNEVAFKGASAKYFDDSLTVQASYTAGNTTIDNGISLDHTGKSVITNAYATNASFGLGSIKSDSGSTTELRVMSVGTDSKSIIKTPVTDGLSGISGVKAEHSFEFKFNLFETETKEKHGDSGEVTTKLELGPRIEFKNAVSSAGVESDINIDLFRTTVEGKLSGSEKNNVNK